MDSNVHRRAHGGGGGNQNGSTISTTTNGSNTQTRNNLKVRKRHHSSAFGSKRKKVQLRIIAAGVVLASLFCIVMYKLSLGNHRADNQRPQIRVQRKDDNVELKRRERNVPDPNTTLTSWGKSAFGDVGYKHSDYMEEIGDKSTDYARLRQKYDKLLPEHDITRMKQFVDKLHKRTYSNINSQKMTYQVHNCPPDPPLGYPQAWDVLKVLQNWAPDDPTPHTQIYQGVCVFDYETERDKAINYRKAEVPFIVRNDPKVLRTTERWNQPGYMQKLLGSTPYRTEYSPNNHFMYWMNPKAGARRRKEKMNLAKENTPNDWQPPTKLVRMPFAEWLSHANVTDDKVGPDMEHWYFRLIGCGEMGNCDRDSSEYLFDELAFFQPREENELYMVEYWRQKGIHCRFGMKGVIAENHFDGSRNMIVVLGGERRYILSHPDQCENLELLPRGHPSARHSAVDWSNPDLEQFPNFRKAKVNEVVLQAGDVLYLPTNWFHYIISLDLNFQCNTRSGISTEYMEPIRKCGF